MDDYVRSRAGPMDVDASDTEWVTTSSTAQNGALLATTSALRSRPSQANLSATSTQQSTTGTPVKKDEQRSNSNSTGMANSPFKIAQHIFNSNAGTAKNENEHPNHPSPMSTPASSNRHSPARSVGSAGSLRRRNLMLGRPFFARRHHQAIDSGRDDKSNTALTTTSYDVYWPFVLMGYLQLAFNLAVVSALLYLAISFYLTIRRDVELKVSERISALLSEIAVCRKQYAANRCDPHLRVPAIEAACVQWEACMQRNPTLVSRAKLSAETFAEIIEGFVEPISYKTMVFVVTAVGGAVFVSNLAFVVARGRIRRSSGGAPSGGAAGTSDAQRAIVPFH